MTKSNKGIINKSNKGIINKSNKGIMNEDTNGNITNKDITKHDQHIPSELIILIFKYCNVGELMLIHSIDLDTNLIVPLNKNKLIEDIFKKWWAEVYETDLFAKSTRQKYTMSHFTHRIMCQMCGIKSFTILTEAVSVCDNCCLLLNCFSCNTKIQEHNYPYNKDLSTIVMGMCFGQAVVGCIKLGCKDFAHGECMYRNRMIYLCKKHINELVKSSVMKEIELK